MVISGGLVYSWTSPSFSVQYIYWSVLFLVRRLVLRNSSISKQKLIWSII